MPFALTCPTGASAGATVPYQALIGLDPILFDDPNGTYDGTLTGSNWNSGSLTAGAAQTFGDGITVAWLIENDTLGEAIDTSKLIQLARMKWESVLPQGVGYWMLIADAGAEPSEFTDLNNYRGGGYARTATTNATFTVETGGILTPGSPGPTLTDRAIVMPTFGYRATISGGIGTRFPGVLLSGGRASPVGGVAGEAFASTGGAILGGPTTDNLLIALGLYRNGALGASTPYSVTNPRYALSQEVVTA